MPVAYVTEPGAAVHKAAGMLVVQKHGQRLAQWPLLHLRSLVLVGAVHLTTPTLKTLLKRGVPAAFLSRAGRLCGRMVPRTPGNVPLRLRQYRLAEDPAARIGPARALVAAKIDAMDDVLRRYAANYPELPLRKTRDALREAGARAARAAGLPQLRGIEGGAAAAYWKAFARLNRSRLSFRGRSSRPPRDPVNALLSLGYVLLTNELWAVLDALGFDPFLGFYHDVKSRRPGLAVDLIEPLRHQVIDRMVLRTVNLGQFAPGDFRQAPGGGTRLAPRAWKQFLTEYERALQNSAGEGRPAGRSWRDVLRKRCEEVRQILLPGERQPDESPPAPHLRLVEPEENVKTL